MTTNGPVQPLEDILVVALEHAVAVPFATRQHPQMHARRRWRDVGTPGGRTARGLPPPATFAGSEAPMRPAPELGRHSATIRAEFGASAPAAGSGP